MAEHKTAMKMPELLVFAKAFVVGLAGAEVIRVAYYAGERVAIKLSGVAWPVVAAIVIACTLICASYAKRRNAYVDTVRLLKSARIDLLVALTLGVMANELVAPWLEAVHAPIRRSDPEWAILALVMLNLVLLSPMVMDFLSNRRREDAQLHFLADEEITSEEQDDLEVVTEAEAFADAVLASKAHSGLVFGVDGPWGVGKTSFINLAQRRWMNASGGSVIVFRFEPLRYASEPNLAERFIRELSAAIQKQAFVPEFKPVASRYSRMLKGRADISFLGFKISLEPTAETIDELLEDIDDVLKRIGKRVIIVIDDLDRLDASSVNNVLFTVRRTFKLSRATYILCYDTENLTGRSGDSEKAREFLEKFVTVKKSLFVDSAAIRRFLERDWSSQQQTHLTVPADRMVRLAPLLGKLADMLGGDNAASYMALIGDMRKVKRFVNAVLLMQIERTDLSKTDFDPGDLINLMLLHLNYPGIFRRIYVEETQGRSGMFGVRRNADPPNFSNPDEFGEFLEAHEGTSRFLLKQLFDVEALGLNAFHGVDEDQLRSRACFNTASNRNLEGYLKLVVRFITPLPQQTFILYQRAVDRVRQCETVKLVLESPELELRRVGEEAHDQFWRVLVNQSHGFSRQAADDAIDTLVDYLPRYSSLGAYDRGLRHRSIYSLALLLDYAGWGEAGRRRSSNDQEVVEIARRIFGEGKYKDRSLIRLLAPADRGVLGWHDLMLFRLVCSADRRGQLHHLQSALILHEDSAATTTGQLQVLALEGMRRLSQEVFVMFKRAFIETGKNFLTEVDEAPDQDFLGRTDGRSHGENEESGRLPLSDRIAGERSAAKGFVLYQLANRLLPSGSGVGCGFYDEAGRGDAGGIGKLMNEYVFGVCFNPDVREDNAYHFLDHCLSSLTSGFFSDEDGYIPTKEGLAGGFDPQRMVMYWRSYRDRILARKPLDEDRRVVTLNYIASYKEDLPGVIAVLDEMSSGSTVRG